MTIQEQIQEAYGSIKRLEATVAALQKQCPHTETYKGLYQWRVGSLYVANICKHCNRMLEILPNEQISDYLQVTEQH